MWLSEVALSQGQEMVTGVRVKSWSISMISSGQNISIGRDYILQFPGGISLEFVTEDGRYPLVSANFTTVIMAPAQVEQRIPVTTAIRYPSGMLILTNSQAFFTSLSQFCVPTVG